MQPSDQREHLQLPAATHRPTRPRFAKEPDPTGDGDNGKPTLRPGTDPRKGPASCGPFSFGQTASKRNCPRFLSDDVLVHPCRVQIRTVRPRKNTQLDGHLGKKLRIGQRAEDSCFGRRQQSRAIGDTAGPITEGNRQPVAGQYRHCLNAPRRGGRYSSG